MTAKSEINILMELCVLDGFASSRSPVYEIVQTLNVLPPTFRANCRYVYNNITYTVGAVDKTKKAVKTKVSKLILEELLTANALDLSNEKVAKILGRTPEPKPCSTTDESSIAMEVEAPNISLLSLPGPSRDIQISQTADCSSGLIGTPSGFDELRHGKTAYIQVPGGGIIKRLTLSSTYSERDVLDEEALKMVEPNVELIPGFKFSLPSDFKFVEDPKPSMIDDPRSVLDKYCRDNGLKMPKFFDCGSTGPSHMPIHAISCVIGETFYQVGVFKDKKIARRISAIKMLDALKKLEGKFGDLLQSSVKLTQEEVLENLAALGLNQQYEAAELEHNPPKKSKFLNTDFNQIENLKYENANEVGKAYVDVLEGANGNCSKELLAFALVVQTESPWIIRPIKRYRKWLNDHEKGIEGFFSELKKELNVQVGMTYFVQHVSICGRYAFMGHGVMTFPWELGFKLVKFGFGQTLSECLNDVMFEMIMHIGVLAAHLKANPNLK